MQADVFAELSHMVIIVATCTMLTITLGLFIATLRLGR